MGLILILIGVLIFILSFFNWVGLLFSIIALILGIIIFLNKAEDKIEGRKDKTKRKAK